MAALRARVDFSSTVDKSFEIAAALCAVNDAQDNNEVVFLVDGIHDDERRARHR